tara:strand:- start:1678 stop:2880 length:1203 start_codon:yes stop_codon:yes gene_type:complete
MGNVDSAKSTLISTITNRILDDGRGSARKKVFKHKHEQETGRTSDISFRYIKVNENKYVTFIDLAGHEKYFKTTIHGINGGLADYAILLVGANMGVLKMTREHLGIIKALQIPFCVVLTKIDICPKNVLERTRREITKIIKRNFNRDLVLQKNECLESIDKSFEKLNLNEELKMFELSNVTGEGLDYFRNFLFKIKNRVNWEKNRSQDTIFWIDNVYYVKGIGIVISGTTKRGEIKINDRLMLGPKDGEFHEVIVKSIHNNFREDISLLGAGISGCINIKSAISNKKDLINKKNIKKGMVLIGKKIIIENKNKAVREFIANITILHHPSTIRIKYEPVIHIGKISQTAKVIEMDKENLRSGDKARVKFRFKYRPEFIEKDDILVFREGRTKGIGKIIELL